MEIGITFRIKMPINKVFQEVSYFMAKYIAIIFLYLYKNTPIYWKIPISQGNKTEV